MNQIVLLGRITADPKTFNIGTDKQMTSFTIATGYDKYTEFTDCVAFEQQAKLVRDHCQKGTMLGVVGRLQTRKYTDKEGKERKSTQVVVSSLTLTSSKNTQQEQTSNSSYNEPAQNKSSYNDFDPPTLTIDSDDLPF